MVTRVDLFQQTPAVPGTSVADRPQDGLRRPGAIGSGG